MTCVRCQASRARAPTRHSPSRRRAPTWPRSNISRSVVRLPVRVHGGAGPARLRTGECARRCITTATTPVWKWTPSSTAGPGDGPRSRSSWVLAGSKTLRGRSSPSPNGALRGAGHPRGHHRYRLRVPASGRRGRHSGGCVWAVTACLANIARVSPSAPVTSRITPALAGSVASSYLPFRGMGFSGPSVTDQKCVSVGARRAEGAAGLDNPRAAGCPPCPLASRN